MTLAYYPGCSMHGTSREYEESLLAVAAALELGLTEIADWSCCGASSAHAAASANVPSLAPAPVAATQATAGAGRPTNNVIGLARLIAPNR